MDAMTKTKFKSQLAALSAMNQGFKSTMGTAPAPAVGGMPPAPLILQPALALHLSALKQHAEEFDKLLKLLGEIVEQI
jgi:hypothetical protein